MYMPGTLVPAELMGWSRENEMRGRPERDELSPVKRWRIYNSGVEYQMR